MPRYLIERKFHPEVQEGDLPGLGKKSREIREDRYPQIEWEHSHVVMDNEGNIKMFCVYGAPTENDVRAHATDLGAHDIVTVYEVAGDVTPTDFPLD
jgi:Protein of unknown function (DUF4242)